MAVYCYKCQVEGCEERGQSPLRIPLSCGRHGTMKRDYRAENAGIAIADLKRSNQHSADEYARLMLPQNKDFASASDPEGKKGMAKWREEHAPAATNKRPYWPGEVDKKVF